MSLKGVLCRQFFEICCFSLFGETFWHIPVLFPTYPPPRPLLCVVWAVFFKKIYLMFFQFWETCWQILMLFPTCPPSFRHPYRSHSTCKIHTIVCCEVKDERWKMKWDERWDSRWYEIWDRLEVWDERWDECCAMWCGGWRGGREGEKWTIENKNPT